MKTIRINIIFMSIFGLFCLASCKLDNYDAPTSGLSGRILDAETGELVQQDIIRGSVIELTEHGYDPVSPEYLVIKNDGTYEDSRLFANTYTVTALRGNFIPTEPEEINIKGQVKLDFNVTPYLRIKDLSISKSEGKIIATFKLDQVVSGNVKKIGLYAHLDPNVGEPMSMVRSEIELNSPVSDTEVFTLEIDPSANSSQMKAGDHFFFRVGALMDMGEAKFNYAPYIQLNI